VNSVFKSSYKTSYSIWASRNIDESGQINLAISKIKEHQLSWILEAWKSVSKKTVLQGWTEAGLEKAFDKETQRRSAKVPSSRVVYKEVLLD